MKILTANRLVDGEVVWLAPDGSWATELQSAEVVQTPEDEARLQAAGKHALAASLVVDVNLVEVSIADGTIRPNRLREQIRALGPTTHPSLGKQARSASPHA
ncbi:DUF2849 domain-containing protein [Tianweitania sediminis]|jgi:hypothetical protein|uniref:DUF2849 domain-containing protein n=1 Tax=Tianweitania sediminis TaxID=1502156 RepID=A0A8J7RHN2_9HYPH|nr:DUF2849 domain-containing protein [Tianweitania sediminis]MBP0437391.1 DUF2849 domain-containing protein [Tianweitania sediminis]HEV7415290.1 DUF2849 domain-containing protein [Tianweitania sediminis]